MHLFLKFAKIRSHAGLSAAWIGEGRGEVGRKKRAADELREWEAAELAAMLAATDGAAMPLLTEDLQRAYESSSANHTL